MSRHYKTAPCWVVRDSDGNPDSDEWDAHHTNEAEALDGIRRIHEDHEEDQTPEEFAASVAVRRGAEAGELALRMDRAAVERRKSLRPVVLDGPCYSIACDGGGPNCWEEPGSGAEGNLHFGPGDEFDPAAWDFREVSGKHYCGDCQVPEVTACAVLATTPQAAMVRFVTGLVTREQWFRAPVPVPLVGGPGRPAPSPSQAGRIVGRAAASGHVHGGLPGLHAPGPGYGRGGPFG